MSYRNGDTFYGTHVIAIGEDGTYQTIRAEFTGIEPVITASGNRVHGSRGGPMTLCGIAWVDNQRNDLYVDCKRCLSKL